MNDETPDQPNDSFPTLPPGPKISLLSDHPTEPRVHALDDHAPGDTPPLPRVGSYQCMRKLNHNGMANVYEARDTNFSERLAIVKIAKAKSSKLWSQSERDGLLHEATKSALAAAANQAYFPLVYDLGYDADWAWFAMQKLSGETLREKLDARKLMVPAGTGIDVETACSWTVEILKALRILHNIGMLHGDVKPANVLVTTEGKVKLLDLGLGKFLHLFNENVSVSGGTPRYLAPEIYMEDTHDHRIDLFAAGVVLYELLVGRLPASLGSRWAEIRDAHQNGCIPESARKADIPEFCKKVIAKAADPDPNRRYKTAEDFLNELEAGLAAWRGTDRTALWSPEDILTKGGPKRKRPPLGTSPFHWEAGLFSYTAGVLGAVAFMALAIGPGWLGFVIAYLPASLLAAWAVSDYA